MDKRIGAQLYTVRDFMRNFEDFDTTIKKVRDIGYKTVQLSGNADFPAEEIKAVMDKYGVEVKVTHRPFNIYCEKFDEAVKYHKTLGCEFPGIGVLPPDFEKSAEGFAEFAKVVAPIAKKFKENGMTLCYHNHSFEFAKDENGRLFYDYVLDVEELGLILDVFWLAAAGIDPARYIKKLGSRIKAIHFKDMTIKKGELGYEMCEVMKGNLDWDSIIEACETAGVEYAFVEQDSCPGNPFESLEISYNNLRTKGFN